MTEIVASIRTVAGIGGRSVQPTLNRVRACGRSAARSLTWINPPSKTLRLSDRVLPLRRASACRPKNSFRLCQLSDCRDDVACRRISRWRG